MTELIREFAPAKINLFLHVGERRSDGYHEVQSLVAFADVGDDLAFKSSSAMTLAVEGPFADSLASGPDNLVLRAAHALGSEIGAPPKAHVVLTKNLPVASGLGGGSADAAATLRGLQRLWGASVADDALLRVAASLGSDVPACLASRTCWMEGRGERLSPAPALPGISVVLVNPGVGVATASVFAGLEDRHGTASPKPHGWQGTGEMIAYLNSAANDLEKPAGRFAPVVEVLTAIRECEGALLARMSGSGATCFGLFETQESAARAARKLAAASTWWVTAARIL